MSVSPGRPNIKPYHLRQLPVLDSLPVKFNRTAEKSSSTAQNRAAKSAEQISKEEVCKRLWRKEHIYTQEAGTESVRAA